MFEAASKVLFNYNSFKLITIKSIATFYFSSVQFRCPHQLGRPLQAGAESVVW